ncbi:hypothetical protein OPIT5_26740 [Opitutaceae bacterium TAV5]|nr:hypothetical protein OPIT5_26740 [Opitutaceae bacterium TAV5]
MNLTAKDAKDAKGGYESRERLSRGAESRARTESDGLKVLHVFKYPPGQGGMDYVQRLHMRRAAAGEGGDVCMALLRRNDRTKRTSEPGLIELGGGAWSLWWSLRRKAARVFAKERPDVSLYYNCWGADMLADVDTAHLRIGYLHSSFPGFDNYIKYFSRWLDGFLCVSPALATRVRGCAEGHARECVASVPCPLNPAILAMAQESESGEEQKHRDSARECVIGYSGRLVKEQKRVDRLPELVRLLERELAGRDWHFEILGDGPERTWLEKELADEIARGRVRFLGWKDAVGVGQILKTWKYYVNVSDYEGLSLAMLEAVAAGCLPVYPNFVSSGKKEEDLPGTASSCLYPAGDMPKASTLISLMEKSCTENGSRISILRKTLKNCAFGRTSSNYLTALGACLDSYQNATPSRTTPLFSARRPSFIFGYNRFYKELIQGKC